MMDDEERCSRNIAMAPDPAAGGVQEFEAWGEDGKPASSTEHMTLAVDEMAMAERTCGHRK